MCVFEGGMESRHGTDQSWRQGFHAGQHHINLGSWGSGQTAIAGEDLLHRVMWVTAFLYVSVFVCFYEEKTGNGCVFKLGRMGKERVYGQTISMHSHVFKWQPFGLSSSLVQTCSFRFSLPEVDLSDNTTDEPRDFKFVKWMIKEKVRTGMFTKCSVASRLRNCRNPTKYIYWLQKIRKARIFQQLVWPFFFSWYTRCYLCNFLWLVSCL